jgi:hypothetical protein
MSLFEHPLWPTLLGYLYIAPGRQGVNGPRHRIQVRKSAPRSLLAMTVECPHCHQLYFPVRETKRQVWTLNMSAKGDVVCRNSAECHAQAGRVRAAMAHAPEPIGALLF